eukprot:8904791-Alexandrium_andersonii.AAC.1
MLEFESGGHPPVLGSLAKSASTHLWAIPRSSPLPGMPYSRSGPQSVHRTKDGEQPIRKGVAFGGGGLLKDGSAPMRQLTRPRSSLLDQRQEARNPDKRLSAPKLELTWSSPI